jgi:heme exporter protein CcmD
MDFSAAHVSFVLAAYAISAVAIMALVATVIIRDRKTRRELDAMKDRTP